MAAKKTLRQRLSPGKMSGWLPGVALFLCLSMVAIGALILLQVGSDPKSSQSALPTAVSAQGYTGLRRLLDGDDHFTVINRYEDTGPAERGDLEIITLDDGNELFLSSFDALDEQKSSASASAEGEETSAEPAVRPAHMARFLTGEVGEVPNPARVNHILYKPLGKAVLIVAPKWDADVDARHPRWAQAPTLRNVKAISDVLQVLVPVNETETERDADGYIVAPAQIPGREVHVGEYTTFSYIPMVYDIQRHSRAAPPKAQRPNPQNDPRILLDNRPDPDLPIDGEVVLSPAAGQDLFDSSVRAGRISGLQTISGPNLQPVLVTADGRPVLSRVMVPGGAATKVPVYLLSDPDLLNNQILAQPEKVVVALDLIDRVTPGAKKPSKFVFNMTFNGLSFDRDLLHALSRPPYVAVPLALLILGLALMWAAFARFGPAQESPTGPPLGRGVRTLADNAARLMAITFREVKLGPAYAIMVRDQVIRGRGFMQVDPAQSLDALAERIGTTHGATDSYLKLKDKAAQVATIHQLIDVTLKLHAWKTEIERAHK